MLTLTVSGVYAHVPVNKLSVSKTSAGMILTAFKIACFSSTSWTKTVYEKCGMFIISVFIKQNCAYSRPAHFLKFRNQWTQI